MKREMRDVNRTTAREIEIMDAKRQMLFKFDILKMSYPTAKIVIPEHTVHSDLEEMQKSYDDTVRRLSLTGTVEDYKKYLLNGFAGIEYIFGKFLGFDMAGFTQQQAVSMSSYERLLIELGEKSYVPSGSGWPVEVRLMFVILLNTVSFIFGKMFLNKTGANMMNMMNMMGGPPSGPQQNAEPRRRMRGPVIVDDELPNV